MTQENSSQPTQGTNLSAANVQVVTPQQPPALILLKDDAVAQQELQGLITLLSSELQDVEKDEALTFVRQVIGMNRMRKQAASGFVPSFPIIPYGVYDVEFSPTVGSEQDLIRPAMILWAPQASTVAVVLPLTTEAWQDSYYFHVDITVPFNSENNTVLIEQIRTVEKVRLQSPRKRTVKHPNEAADRNLRLGKIATIDPSDIKSILQTMKRFYRIP